jgi:hypothetical protein
VILAAQNDFGVLHEVQLSLSARSILAGTALFAAEKSRLRLFEV